MNQLAVIYICLSLACLIFYWALARRDKWKATTALDFLLYGGNLTLSPLVGTMVATNLSLGNMIFVCATMGYFFGWSGVFWMVATIVLLPLGFMLIRREAKMYIEETDNFGSIHDYIARSHGGDNADNKASLRRLASTISSISLLFAITIELHLATLVTTHFFPIQQEVLFIIFMAFTVIYALSAGFRSVVTTDVGQSLLILAATVCGIAFFAMLPDSGTMGAQYPFSVQGMLTDVGIPAMIGFSIIGIGWLLCTPDTWQRNCAARNANVSIRGMVIATVILVGFVALFSIAGMGVKALVEPLLRNGVELSKGEFPLRDIFFLHGQSFLLDLMLAVIAVGLLMAAISTCDTFLVVAAHSLAVDFFPHLKGSSSLPSTPDDISDMTLLRARLLLGLLTACVLVLWLLIRGSLTHPIAWFFVVYSFQFALLSPVVMAKWPVFRSYLAARRSIVFGAAATLIVGAWTLVAPEDYVLGGVSVPDIQSLLPVIALVSGMLIHVFSTLTEK